MENSQWIPNSQQNSEPPYSQPGDQLIPWYTDRCYWTVWKKIPGPGSNQRLKLKKKKKVSPYIFADHNTLPLQTFKSLFLSRGEPSFSSWKKQSEQGTSSPLWVYQLWFHIASPLG